MLSLQLLFDAEFSRVEKIKVAGYTYMAACGLEPGRRDSTASWASSRSNDTSVHNAVVLARFAARMMAVLRALNKDAFQAFNLRVGTYFDTIREYKGYFFVSLYSPIQYISRNILN